MPKQIFRKSPPPELLHQLLIACGLEKGAQDTKSFAKSAISIKAVEELLPELEPYYLPCLVPKYLHTTPFTPIKAITILRHVLQAHSIELYSIERTVAGVRGVWYQLQNPDSSFIEGEIHVDFT